MYANCVAATGDVNSTIARFSQFISYIRNNFDDKHFKQLLYY